MKSDAVLVLETGQTFPARRFGAGGNISAELVFTTAMVGYVETLTDPSYHGQIVCRHFADRKLRRHDGGFESESPRLSAYVVRQYCDHPSTSAARRTLTAT
jgi:carbamoyl-phosphate synthase small subunit